MLYWTAADGEKADTNFRLLRLGTVVTGAVAGLKIRCLRGAYLDAQATEVTATKPFGRVIGQQILGAQLLADAAKGLVKALLAGGIIMLASSVVRELDE